MIYEIKASGMALFRMSNFFGKAAKAQGIEMDITSRTRIMSAFLAELTRKGIITKVTAKQQTVYNLDMKEENRPEIVSALVGACFKHRLNKPVTSPIAVAIIDGFMERLQDNRMCSIVSSPAAEAAGVLS